MTDKQAQLFAYVFLSAFETFLAAWKNDDLIDSAMESAYQMTASFLDDEDDR